MYPGLALVDEAVLDPGGVVVAAGDLAAVVHAEGVGR
jgi:hypothetical protein